MKSVWIVPVEGQGQRLDLWLSAQLPSLSRRRIQSLIREGHITLNGKPAKPSALLLLGAKVDMHIPPSETPSLESESMELSILYEDNDLVVVNKPWGLVVYPGSGNRKGTLIQGLLHGRTLASVGAPERPGVVHRLDKETSGVILFAKNDPAYYELVRQFKERIVQKTYLALVHGRIEDDHGRIEAPIGRDPHQRQRMGVRERGGRPALTDFQVRRRLADTTLLVVRPHTGRTHQIRVHLTAIGHPIVGDPVYGRKNRADGSGRLMLHAWKLSIQHPRSREKLEFIAPLPPEFQLYQKDVSSL